MPMAKFKVPIYNAVVSKFVKEGKRHSQLSNDWADLRGIEIEAVDEAHARAKIEIMHPRAQGFVVDSIVKIDRD